MKFLDGNFSKSRVFMVGTLTLCLSPVSSAEELSREEKLGKLLFNDTSLSLERNQSCASCHSLKPVKVATEKPNGKLHTKKQQSVSFADPDNIQNGTAVADGSVSGEFGTLNTPSAGYAAFAPVFHWDSEEELYIGGQFWNGRADTLKDQASAPPLNPVEMAMPSEWAVITRVKESRQYVHSFKNVYGIDLDSIPPYELAPAELVAPEGVIEAYEAMAQAIGEFEKTPFFYRFDSKFDFVEAGVIEYSELEQLGADLFDEKAMCAACHVAAPDGTAYPALLTDFSYDNLGVPRNVNIPGNPEPNPGLGGNPLVVSDARVVSEVGKQKVMSLRNIELTPPYMHNGVFGTLEEVVHFYNTRDVKDYVCQDNNDPGFGVNCWPAAEFPETVNIEELGNLGLTPDEEAAIVAYLKTFTDNYPEWGNDPAVPPGTPSPYRNALPPLP